MDVNERVITTLGLERSSLLMLRRAKGDLATENQTINDAFDKVISSVKKSYHETLDLIDLLVKLD